MGRIDRHRQRRMSRGVRREGEPLPGLRSRKQIETPPGLSLRVFRYGKIDSSGRNSLERYRRDFERRRQVVRVLFQVSWRNGLLFDAAEGLRAPADVKV